MPRAWLGIWLNARPYPPFGTAPLGLHGPVHSTAWRQGRHALSETELEPGKGTTTSLPQKASEQGTQLPTRIDGSREEEKAISKEFLWDIVACDVSCTPTRNFSDNAKTGMKTSICLQCYELISRLVGSAPCSLSMWRTRCMCSQ
jgi:hypothetical protein